MSDEEETTVVVVVIVVIVVLACCARLVVIRGRRMKHSFLFPSAGFLTPPPPFPDVITCVSHQQTSRKGRAGRIGGNRAQRRAAKQRHRASRGAERLVDEQRRRPRRL